MTTVVAVVLALAATGLKDMQDKNVELANKREILKSVGLGDVEDVNTVYDNSIVELVVNNKGEIIESDANGQPLIASKIDVKKEKKKPLEERNLPLYKFKSEKGETAYIV